VVRIPGYRYRRPGIDSRHYQIFWKVEGLERGPLSLVSITEELIEWEISGYGLQNREYGRGDPLRWPRDTLYPQKLTLTSPTSGGRSVGIVSLRTKVTEFSFCSLIYLTCVLSITFRVYFFSIRVVEYYMGSSANIFLRRVTRNKLLFYFSSCINKSHRPMDVTAIRADMPFTCFHTACRHPLCFHLSVHPHVFLLWHSLWASNAASGEHFLTGI
jgi:hypothetical protein